MSKNDVIDFVIPWVDGGDPEWATKKARYLGENTSYGNEVARFRDWEILRYWFRAVEEYAPWVRYVFFVTDNQKPDWLNLDHPKLKWVKHTDYIPEEYLPTFSSHTIELNFHRIKEMSEYFVYFNDDVFLNAPVDSEYFFKKGKPCASAVLEHFSPSVSRDAYLHTIVNDIGFINTHFNKREVMCKNFMLWFNLKYRKYVLKNLYYAGSKQFSDIHTSHISASMLKTTYEEVWKLEPELLHSTCKNKFRSLSDVNQYIFSYYNICQGNFIPRRVDFGKSYGIEQDNKRMYADLLQGKSKVICINDHSGITDFEKEKKSLVKIFEQKLPRKSSFEL